MTNLMTPEKALALRQPFPAETIGKLPKSTCRDCSQSQRKRCDRHQWVSHCPECKGSHTSATMHLDYVGHAAVTDRLLTVDPGWSWDFSEVDPATGNPSLRHSLDPDGNLWIRLTICGVTRIGVGDGKSAKERIGDAIRNAAMRFGMALDLWAKENLVEFQQHIAAPQTSGAGGAPVDSSVAGSEPGNPAPEPRETGVLMTKRSRGEMFALFAQKGVAEADQLSGINHLCGTDYTSRGDLTEADARKVVEFLRTRPDVDDTPLAEGAES